MRRKRTLQEWCLYILGGCVVLVLIQLLLRAVAS